jgi:hypothetical protein
MYKETVTIRLDCDSKGCSVWHSVTDDSGARCSISLFEMGWRLHRGKQGYKHLCPRHAALEARRDADISDVSRANAL